MFFILTPYPMIPPVDTNPLDHTSWLQWFSAVSNSLKSTILFSKKPWRLLLNVLIKLRFTPFYGISLILFVGNNWRGKNMFPGLELVYCGLTGAYLDESEATCLVPERSFFESWFCKWHRNHDFKCFYLKVYVEDQKYLKKWCRALGTF